MYLDVRLLRIRAVLAIRQALRQKDVVPLVHHPVADLQLCQLRHPLRAQAGLLTQLAARHLLRIDLGLLPPPLRQLDIALAYRVPELLDKVDELALRRAIQRNDDASRVLVDDPIDPALTIRALNDVLANTRPPVAVDLAAADSFNSVRAQAFFSVAQ